MCQYDTDAPACDHRIRDKITLKPFIFLLGHDGTERTASMGIIKRHLSYDAASGSEIMPCNKIDKTLVVYRYDVHNNVAIIMTKL